MPRTNEFGQPIGDPVSGWNGCPQPGDVTLTGRVCRLERINVAKHANDLFAVYSQSDGRMWTYLLEEPFTKIDEFHEYMDRCARSTDPRHYAVIDLATSKAIGTMSLMRIDPKNGVIEVGFVTFSPLLQRSTHSTEAQFLLIAYAFDELGYRRYEWKCDSLNEPSRKAAERLGFIFEGIFHGDRVYKGRNRDTAWFAITVDRWPKLKAAFEAWLSLDNFDSQGSQINSLAELRIFINNAERLISVKSKLNIGFRLYKTMFTNFGSEFETNWPQKWPVYTEFALKLLRECVNVEKPTPLMVEQLNQNSDAFPIKFPISTCRVKSQPCERLALIEKQAASAYPVIHERVLWLYLTFLEHKSKHGDDVTKKVLANLSLTDFVTRLLTKRCVSFVGEMDAYLLLSGEEGTECYRNKETLSSTELISYDEVKLSAFLSIASHSDFINSGDRYNVGKVATNESTIERSGVIIGLIGARFERPGVMEFQDICVTKQQNTLSNGYGPKPPATLDSVALQRNFDLRSIWNEFYDEPSQLFNETGIDGIKLSKISDDHFFNNVAMKKRFAISIDTLLLEAQSRAEEMNKMAYVHVVGIGLGVWMVADQQEEIFLRTFEQRLKYLADRLPNVGWINFAWFRSEYGDIRNGNIIKTENGHQNGITIFLTRRNPADKLEGDEYSNSLLVVSYAWDGNALPGNEFWMGSLSGSGDPAAACSTLISELHNSHINVPMVSGRNLHISSPHFGLLHIAAYAKTFIEEINK